MSSIIKKRLSYLTIALSALLGFPSSSECQEVINLNNAKIMELKASQPCQDNAFVYLTLADALGESGDLLASLNVLNQLINQKEADRIYDQTYVKALYEARSIYVLIDFDKTMELHKKIEIYDKNLPEVRLENGFLIAEKMPQEARDKEGQLFIKKMIISAGLCESSDDIEFSCDQMKIKLKPCCSCRCQ